VNEQESGYGIGNNGKDSEPDLKSSGSTESRNQKHLNSKQKKGYWRISGSPILSKTLTNEVLELKGYTSLKKQYLSEKIC